MLVPGPLVDEDLQGLVDAATALTVAGDRDVPRVLDGDQGRFDLVVDVADDDERLAHDEGGPVQRRGVSVKLVGLPHVPGFAVPQGVTRGAGTDAGDLHPIEHHLDGQASEVRACPPLEVDERLAGVRGEVHERGVAHGVSMQQVQGRSLRHDPAVQLLHPPVGRPELLRIQGRPLEGEVDRGDRHGLPPQSSRGIRLGLGWFRGRQQQVHGFDPRDQGRDVDG